MGARLASTVINFLRARERTSDHWQIEIQEAKEGCARIRMVLREDMLNGHGKAHGGIIFAFADTAFGYACNSRNVRAVGAQASIIFLQPASKGEVLIAHARERTVSGRSGVYDVSVKTAEGRAIAEFRGYSRIVGGHVMKSLAN